MPIRINCPSCNAAHVVDEEQRGRTIRCTRCNNPVDIPGASEEQAKKKTDSAGIQPARRPKAPSARRRDAPVDVEDEDPGISSTGLYLIVGSVAAGLLMCLSGIGIGAYFIFRDKPADRLVAKTDNDKKAPKIVKKKETDASNPAEKGDKKNDLPDEPGDKEHPEDVARDDPKISDDQKSPIFGGVVGTPFQDLAPDGSVLVGFDVGIEKFGDEEFTRSIRPIFRNAAGEETRGPDRGTKFTRRVTMKAKPGYAIGALVIEAGHGLDGLQALYMRLNTNDLDPKDHYLSDSVGRKITYPKTANGNGVPIIGIIGKVGTKECTGLGVVFKGTVTVKLPNDQKSPIFGGVVGSPFQDMAPHGSILVGFEVGLGKIGVEDSTQSIKPIYRYATGEEIMGVHRGKILPPERTVTMKAKPGYAVGAVVIRAGHGMTGLQATFMRVNGDSLDPTDKYTSDSVGRKVENPNLASGYGVPIVGIVGTATRDDCTGLGVVFNAKPQGGVTSLAIPSFGGGVMASDNKMLIVALTSAGMLGYYDSMTAKEIKKVEVDFQPNVLAIQGNTLFIGTKGSAIIHVFEADTAKKIKTIKIPGEPVRAMAVHPERGPLYVSNSASDVFVVDSAAGSYKKTNARGESILMDPSSGKYLFTASLSRSPDTLTKYEFEKDDKLKVISIQDNAVVNGRGIVLRPDGKAVGMFGAGGWQPRKGGKNSGFSAMFDTSDMNTMLGQIEFGANQYITFHPALKLGAAWRAGGSGEIAFFNSHSFAIKEITKVKEEWVTAAWMTFGARGTKLIFCTGSQLVFLPMELSAEDRDILKRAYPQ